MFFNNELTKEEIKEEEKKEYAREISRGPECLKYLLFGFSLKTLLNFVTKAGGQRGLWHGGTMTKCSSISCLKFKKLSQVTQADFVFLNCHLSTDAKNNGWCVCGVALPFPIGTGREPCASLTGVTAPGGSVDVLHSGACLLL